jgi:hypothetical protein
VSKDTLSKKWMLTTYRPKDRPGILCKNLRGIRVSSSPFVAYAEKSTLEPRTQGKSRWMPLQSAPEWRRGANPDALTHNAPWNRWFRGALTTTPLQARVRLAICLSGG